VTVLLFVGVGVVVLGGLVLLLFPDRPGGKIAWQGVEVSSLGAGLPLIVVGIVAIALASGGAAGGDGDDPVLEASTNGMTASTGRTTSAFDCPGLPKENVVNVPQGEAYALVAGSAEPKAAEPFVLHFIDDGQTVGALAASWTESGVFLIHRFVDAECRDSEVVSLPGRAPLDALPNATNVLIPDLMGRSYTLVVNSSAEIRAVFKEFTER
jgi:hypothetical protein